MPNDGRPEHWSFSSLQKFETCRRKWKHRYIDKIPEPKGPALERGIIVHEMLERALTQKRGRGLRGLTEVAPGWLSQLVEKYRALRGIVAEAAIHIDRRWKAVANPENRWIPRGTWATGKLDLLADGFFGDWKTGRMYLDKHEDQSELYGLMLTATTGHTEWDCDLIYVDQEHVESLAFDFSDPAYFAERKRAWEKRAEKIYTEKRFPKTPGDHCKWCPYHKNKGGPCDG